MEGKESETLQHERLIGRRQRKECERVFECEVEQRNKTNSWAKENCIGSEQQRNASMEGKVEQRN